MSKLIIFLILSLWLTVPAIADDRAQALQRSIDRYKANLKAIKNALPEGINSCVIWHSPTPPPPDCVLAIEKIELLDPLSEQGDRDAEIRQFQESARDMLKALEETQGYIPIQQRSPNAAASQADIEQARQRIQMMLETLTNQAE